MDTTQPDRTDEFVKLVSQHQSQLYGHVYALVQNAADADDLVQKTVLTLWRRFGEFERDTDFAAWAWRTARYEVMNFLKSRRRSRVLFGSALAESLADRAASVEAETDPTARAEALSACIEQQPDEDRQLLRMRYEGERKVKDMADQYGRSPQSITNSLRRIRVALFECVERRLAREGGV
ncbi:MAG: sigma-70 family RNA polymerase sigma factor [Pirellulales bacterium]|nr:sigma-70 family RNA polymerase sigma factor [Pirellulales bacterium]